MATFADTSEAEKYIGGIFEAGFADPDVRQALARSGLVLRMNLSQPDAVITVDLPAAQVHYGDADAPTPNMTMTLDGETANRFWQGKVSIPLAVARKHITVSVGVATLRPGDTTQSLIGRADGCLYAAKRAGRNRVICETDPEVVTTPATAVA